MGIGQRIGRIRREHPFLDHLVRMQDHFGDVKAGQQAGAITYFGFVSVFPILALSFAIVGFVARVNPVDAGVTMEDLLLDAIEVVLPGLIDAATLEVVRENAPGIASIGVLVVLYSGLGWLSAMRASMLVVFRLPAREQPSFLVGKLRDLASLFLIGTTMLVTVAVAGLVNSASTWLLGFIPLGPGQEWLLKLLAILVGLAASTVLFYFIFRLLARPSLPSRSLWSGALFGAVGFEVLKQAATYLLVFTREGPAFQVFGIALILVVWIHYFALVLMYAAAFAYTDPASRAQRLAQQGAEGYDGEYDGAPLTLDEIERTGRIARHGDRRPGEARRRLAVLGTGMALGAAGAAAVLKRDKTETTR